MSPSKIFEEKVQRLLASGAAHPLVVEAPDLWVGAVDGDHGRYLVTVVAPELTANLDPPVPACSCTCEAGRVGTLCTHIGVAALLLEHADPGRPASEVARRAAQASARRGGATPAEVHAALSPRQPLPAGGPSPVPDPLGQPMINPHGAHLKR